MFVIKNIVPTARTNQNTRTVRMFRIGRKHRQGGLGHVGNPKDATASYALLLPYFAWHLAGSLIRPKEKGFLVNACKQRSDTAKSKHDDWDGEGNFHARTIPHET